VWRCTAERIKPIFTTASATLKINVRSTWDQKLDFIFAPLLMQMFVGTRTY